MPARRPAASSKYWIQSALAKHKKGALHRDLGVPQDDPIPRELIIEAIEHPERFKATPVAQLRLQRRARLALRLRGFAKKRRRR